MEKVLIIGASGLLGSRAAAMGMGKYDVYGTFMSNPIKTGNFFRLDVTDRDSVSDMMNEIRPDFVLDTHALHNVDYCETHQEEAWRINVEGTKNVATASMKIGAKYIFISTDYVFSGNNRQYAEDDTPDPLNYYGKTKMAAETLLRDLETDHIISRSSVIYGIGGMGKKSFALWVLEKLKNNETISIVSDQYNNPTFVDSMVHALFSLFEKDRNGTFHITGKDCISRYEFAKEISSAFGLDGNLIVPVSTSQLKQVAARPGRVCMSTGKVEEATGLGMMSVSEGISALKNQLGEIN